MNMIIYSTAILLFSGVISLLLSKKPKLSNLFGGSGSIFGCFIGLYSIYISYINKFPEIKSMGFKIPYAHAFALKIDAFSSLFLIPVFLVSGIAALYGIEYLKHYYSTKNIGNSWFFYNLLICSMVFVIISSNALLFLLAWEMMSVSSFFLVLFDGQKKSAQKAGFIYLVATHIGTLFLLVMFILLAKNSGSFDFNTWTTILPKPIPSIIFLCAIIGFGTKAGFVPLHIWLPEAHPAAPSHVSAVMSGVMIKTGIYGLLRVLTFLGVPNTWWSYTLIIIGVLSGVLGVLFALAQHDIKKLLAYHSIENIGIITIGIGIGVLGMSLNNPVLIVFGFAGGLLHILNHALFKGLLFLGSGIIYQQAGTREIDVLGGLLKKMPITGASFLIGSAAICGLPPLNGFISEFLIYWASFKNLSQSPLGACTFSFVIVSLALIGALALVCFTKAFGIIFLGEPRSNNSEKSSDPGNPMKISLILLSGLCILAGVGAPYFILYFEKIIFDLTGYSLPLIQQNLKMIINPLNKVIIVGILLFLLISLLSFLRWILLRKREKIISNTWGCGYSKPCAAMQYTASSYAQPVVNFFKGILHTEENSTKINEYFPENTLFDTETPDLFSNKIFRPLLKNIHFLTKKLTWFQHGKLQSYILYILFTLIALLIWKL